MFANMTGYQVKLDSTDGEAQTELNIAVGKADPKNPAQSKGNPTSDATVTV